MLFLYEMYSFALSLLQQNLLNSRIIDHITGCCHFVTCFKFEISTMRLIYFITHYLKTQDCVFVLYS
jgi:hypothetical protein